MTVQELRDFLEHKQSDEQVVVLRALYNFSGGGGWEPYGEDMEIIFAEDSDEVRLIVDGTTA